MAELLFKRGTHAKLPTTGKAVDGAFYLTTDTHRLYAGIGTDLVDLNQYINVVKNLTEANALPNLKEGDFVYLTEGNILAIVKSSNGKLEYVQVNAQGHNTSNKELTVTGKGNTITLTVTDDLDNSVFDTFQVLGTKGANVAVGADGSITVDGVTYSVSGALANGTFNVQLAPDADHAANCPNSSVSLKAGNNVTFSSDAANSLTISSKNTKIKKGTFTADKTGSASVTITDEDDNSAKASITNGFYYTVGKKKTTVYNQNDLGVYTIDEVDKIVKDLNAMVYMGPVDADPVGTLKTSATIRRGDTYMASGAITLSELGITTNNGVTTSKIGDLFIATGTEGDDGYLDTVIWTYIPSGDDSQTDTTYHGVADAANHKLNLEDKNDTKVAAIQLTGSDKISLASVATDDGKGLKTTFTHAGPGAADATKQNSTVGSQTLNSEGFALVSDVTVDATGHVSDVKKTSVKLPTYALSGATVAKTGNVVSVTDSLNDSQGNAAGTSVFQIAADQNDSLKIAAAGNKITLSLEWEEF